MMAFVLVIVCTHAYLYEVYVYSKFISTRLIKQYTNKHKHTLIYTNPIRLTETNAQMS